VWPCTGAAQLIGRAGIPGRFHAGARRRRTRCARAGCIPTQGTRGRGATPSGTDTSHSAAPHSPKIGAAAEEVPGGTTLPTHPEIPPYRGELGGDRRDTLRRPPRSHLQSRPASPPSVDPGTFGYRTGGGEAATPRAGSPRANTPAAHSTNREIADINLSAVTSRPRARGSLAGMEEPGVLIPSILAPLVAAHAGDGDLVRAAASNDGGSPPFVWAPA